MKYVVEVCYGNRNEWSEDTEDYREATAYAMKVSQLEGVSEARVYIDDEIAAIYVDGLYHYPQEDDEDEDEDEWAEYDEPNYPFDEWGYDPYGGCFDPDL